MTMLEASKLSQDVVERAISKIIVEKSPMLEVIPQKGINGGTYRYNLEGSLGTVAFRGVNAGYTPNNGVINPQFESLVILGGEVKIDKYIVEVQSNMVDAKKQYYGMKARAFGIYYSEQFVEGDTAVNPYGFDGIRKRAAGNQLLAQTAGGVTLTLDMLDLLLDAVVGENSEKMLIMNKTMRRKVTSLSRVGGAGQQIVYKSDDLMGYNRQLAYYADAPIRVIERDDDASTYLGFDEDDGLGNLDTTSIYCFRPGMEYLHGIMHGSLPTVEDFPPAQPGPFHIGRIEGYMGIVWKHPRSAARLTRINNA
jgi:hypothetical protein